MACMLFAVTLVMSTVAFTQEAPKQNSGESVTIVTTGDLSVTKKEGKTFVCINFAPGNAKSKETRTAISGPYTLDVNGGVQEVQGPQGTELHVLSHDDLRFEAPEISTFEQSHKYNQYTACSKIPKFAGCGHPVCDQFGHPGDQCRYNSSSGCACVAAGGGPCAETANGQQDKK
jgi:hypothetical protein